MDLSEASFIVLRKRVSNLDYVSQIAEGFNQEAILVHAALEGYLERSE